MSDKLFSEDEIENEKSAILFFLYWLHGRKGITICDPNLVDEYIDFLFGDIRNNG